MKFDERHEIEQYFWDDATIARVADVAQKFESVCALCAPLLGAELNRRGQSCRILDIDARFVALDGYESYDLYRPNWRAETYGLIVCDPPFWKVSLSQLFGAIRLLAHYDWAQPLLICYPQRRGANLCGTFARFGLQPIVRPEIWRATYRTLPAEKLEAVIFFSNCERLLEEEMVN